ncbi:family 16 glycosylhydrolase [Marinomonas flavescens]|uniref:family 16 glycosylhydrolase n=1 Tax=Marinomonas flavescens TaxID=2529379 RepID=UPI0014050F7D|nr:family 16 glycosylhydrolase [Marinomonas flavescens]
MPKISKKISIFASTTCVALLVTGCSVMDANNHKTVGANGVGVSPNQIQANVPNGTASEWELVNNLSDEFNGTTIAKSKWTTDINQFDGPWAWDPKNVTVANGNLDITMRHVTRNVQIPNKKGKRVTTAIHYTSGMLKSKSKMIFGYYEARIQGVSTFPGSSPAFWLYSNVASDMAAGLIGKKDGDTAYSEVDVVEMQQERSSIHKIDMHGPYQIMKNGKHVFVRRKDAPYSPVTVDFDPSKGFHTYGVMVSRKSLTYYVDGVKVISQPNDHWNHLPMNLALSLGLRAPNLTYKDCKRQAITT